MIYKTEIWKVQRPIVTNDPEPQVLIYNEDRSRQGSVPLTAEIAQLFNDDEYKIFIHGTIAEDGQIEFEEPAEWQEW